MPTTAQTRQASYGPDQALYAAASGRGAMRNEVYTIAVTTASKRYLVPDAWKGAHVRIYADAGDVGYQLSTGTDAAADLTVRAAEAAPDGTGSIALTVAPSGCGRVASGQAERVPVPPNATTFALVGSVACVARCHLAET
jgi:hypothetical protein